MRRAAGVSAVPGVLPPRMEPSTPRMISRPTVEPMDRAADLATVSSTESLRPLPLSMLLAKSLNQPLEAPPLLAGDAAVRPLSFS